MRWLIYFEDKSHGLEVFTDEACARQRFAEASIAWSCHLFVEANHLTPDLARLMKDKIALTAERDQLLKACDDLLHLYESKWSDEPPELIEARKAIAAARRPK